MRSDKGRGEASCAFYTQYNKSVYTISHPVRKRNGYIYLWLVHDQWRSLPFHKPPKEDGLICLEGTIQEDKNRSTRCGDSPMPFRGLLLSARLSRQLWSPRPPPRDTNRSWLSFYENVPASKLFYGNRCIVEGQVCDIFTCVIIYYRSLLKIVEGEEWKMKLKLF